MRFIKGEGQENLNVPSHPLNNVRSLRQEASARTSTRADPRVKGLAKRGNMFPESPVARACFPDVS